MHELYNAQLFTTFAIFTAGRKTSYIPWCHMQAQLHARVTNVYKFQCEWKLPQPFTSVTFRKLFYIHCWFLS